MDGQREGQSREDFESQVIGTDVGTVKAGEFARSAPTAAAATEKPKVKAVLFVAENTKITPDLDIQVVSINPAGLNAIVARRC